MSTQYGLSQFKQTIVCLVNCTDCNNINNTCHLCSLNNRTFFTTLHLKYFYHIPGISVTPLFLEEMSILTFVQVPEIASSSLTFA